MSSTKNNKRKRGSKAGINSTASNRQQRAVAPDSAQDSAITSSTSTADNVSRSTPITNNIAIEPSASDETEASSSSQLPTVAREKGGTKNTNEQVGVKKVQEPINNDKNNEKEKVDNSSSSSSNENMTDKKSNTNSLDASSSCSSSEDGTSTTRRHALHTASYDDDDDDNHHRREKRMQDMILHRSMLLERVKSCRSSAEKRIGEFSSKSQGNNSNNELTDDEEIAAFRNMTKRANQAARKNNRGDGDGKGGTNEKRTSLSLRRGSNIGKRMNAALSSLVPGSNLTTNANANAVDSNDVAAQTSVSVSDKCTSSTKSAIKVSPSSKSNISQKATRLPVNPIGTSTTTTTNTKTVVQANNSNPKSNKVTPYPIQSTKQSEVPRPQPRGRPPNSKNNKTSNKLSGQSGGSQQLAPTSSIIARTDQNTNKSAGPTMMTTNNFNPRSSLAQASASSKVHFPEAILLREKRDQVQMKLRNLMERQQHSNDPSIMTMSGGGMKSNFDDEAHARRAVTTAGGVTSKPLMKKKINVTTELEIPSPAQLPQRRKTHWDTLLQEMSWLASDFMEERKWKLSTARLISSKIPAQGISSDRRKRSAEVISHDASRDLHIDNIALSASSLDNPNSSRETKHLNKKDTRRRYTPPATEDENIAKSNSQILSCMISELDVAIKQGGSFEVSDKYHQAALKQFVSTRSDILEKLTAISTSKYLATQNHPNDKLSPIKQNDEDTTSTANTVDMIDVDNNNKDDSRLKDSNFDSINDYIDNIHNVCRSRYKSSTRESTTKSLKSGNIKLAPKQKEMIDFVDKVWSGKPCTSAMILGPTISGKTFATATIIWKQRTKGPQLLICPPRSMIRWKHELNLFSNIRVLTFGLVGGISNPNGSNDVGEIKPADVIVCEYSTVNRMKSILNAMSVSLYSVIIDLRHFHGLLESLGTSSSSSGVDPHFPPELLSNNWWGDIIAVSKKRDTRCLFVDYCDADPLSLSKCGLGQKEQIRILAKRAACIIGPEIFDSGSHSIQRQVISWARKRGKNGTTDKATRIRNVLSDVIDPMCFRVENQIVSSSDFKWDLRPCTMSSAQREEYEKCCYAVRGALSLTLLDDPKKSSSSHRRSISVASNALFRLRQHCFHAKGLEIHSTSASHNGHSSCLNAGNNPSQPDFDSVYSILRSSAKLKELVLILVEKGGYSINCDESTRKLLGLNGDVKTDNKTKKSAKKVAIFAALPDIQHLVSTLLNSLGIQNELFRRDSSYAISGKNAKLDVSLCSNLDHHQKRHEVTAWAESQSALSRFCDKKNSRKTNIIVAAPAVFFGRNCGLGVEGADMIITLDSDWSGRDGYIVDSLIRRWRAKNELVGKEDKLIRLVCADSVESKLFSDCNNHKGAFAWPLDSEGFLTIPSSQDEALKIYRLLIERDAPSYFSFPAVDILKKRGDLLSDVLASSRNMPSFFGSGEAATFLPRRNSYTIKPAINEEEITTELQFLRNFLQKEQTSSLVSIQLSALEKVSMTPTLLSYGSTLPAGSMSRQDLPVIASRLFLEKLMESHSVSNNFGVNSSSQSLQPMGSFTNDSADVDEVPLDPAIDGNPSSLLFYEPCQELFQINSKRRYNAYAKIFSSSWDGINVRDGNQGCEPLVFFPPLFPLLEECSKRARIGHQATSSSKVDSNPQEAAKVNDNVENDQLLKRKDRGLTEVHADVKPDLKRLKTQSPPSEMNGHVNALSSVGAIAPESSAQTNGSTPVVSKEKVVIDNAITKTVAVGPNSEIESKVDENESNGFIMIEEDFGLLGAGAIPKPIDAISFSVHDTKATNSAIFCDNRYDFTSFNFPCDAEETGTSALENMDEGMQSVLLFVKKRPMSYLESQTSYRFAQGASGIVPLSIGNKSSKDPSADESGKKTRKRGSQLSSQMPHTAFTRLPGSVGAQLNQIVPRSPLPANSRQMKGDHRHKLLASYYARQRITGLTLFDSIPYRVAAMRVERRVAERLERLMWKSTLTHDSGPGLPIQLVEESYSIDKDRNSPCQGWASIIEELKDGSMSGDTAIFQSNMQRQELRRSLVSPRCVDFGAFEVGYLASPSGMTGISTPRFRVGVSLPMGVKVMQPTREQKILSSWNLRDDKILQDSAKKFGMNWLLVASAMSGFEHVVTNESLTGIERLVPSIPKSARQCRDRWQALAQNEPSLANEVRKSERLFRENASLRCDKIETNKESNKEGKVEVRLAARVSILSKSSNFINPTQTRETYTDNQNEEDGTRNDMDIVNDVPNGIASSISNTVDKKQDDATGDHKSSNVVCDSKNKSAGATPDVDMTDRLPPQDRPKPKRRSFSAMSISRSRRQVIPMSIPGVVAGENQAGHPVPSHPSHMQSVQSSVTALWASGRTEMWPLQILDLADKQRSGAAAAATVVRTGSLQRGDISTTSNNSSRRHGTDNTAYQHRYPPPSSQPTSSVRGAPVVFSPVPPNVVRPVAPRPVNTTVPPHHQQQQQQQQRHRNPPPPVAAATVQAYIPPPPTSVTKPPSNNEKQTKSTTKDSAKKE